MRVLPYGADAALVEVSSLDEVGAVRAALLSAAESGELPGLVELVPGARTVLAAFTPGSAGLGALPGLLRDVEPTARPPVRPREVTLRVRYDGPDLDLVAETAGLSTEDVVALHTGAEYTVAFCGFAPGFGYLTGLAEPLRQPRLDSPRSSVPAGSVGVAGEFTAAYPRSSPGGWRLIGRTDATLFDPRAERPSLLTPGDVVRFEAVR
ncbi:MAG: 5-oxoprolinase subunit PxpB [Sciscionella sp.]